MGDERPRILSLSQSVRLRLVLPAFLCCCFFRCGEQRAKCPTTQRLFFSKCVPPIDRAISRFWQTHKLASMYLSCIVSCVCARLLSVLSLCLRFPYPAWRSLARICVSLFYTLVNLCVAFLAAALHWQVAGATNRRQLKRVLKKRDASYSELVQRLERVSVLRRARDSVVFFGRTLGCRGCHVMCVWQLNSASFRVHVGSFRSRLWLSAADRQHKLACCAIYNPQMPCGKKLGEP